MRFEVFAAVEISGRTLITLRVIIATPTFITASSDVNGMLLERLNMPTNMAVYSLRCVR
jgi:hypothetical protein